MPLVRFRLWLVVTLLTPAASLAQTPAPPGKLVDIGGQRIHLHCTGRGSPTVLLENGVGDSSTTWSLVQPRVARTTRVCSYDRGGNAWSQPGSRPRTFAQLALELHTALDRSAVAPPYVLVGQSYGGLVVRGFARDYPADVVGMVLVDAVHEDQRTVYGGQAHRIRESAKGRPFPAPRISLDTLSPGSARDAEMDWSPEELARFHDQRAANRTSLGDLPLIVLARTDGGYPSGMKASPQELEEERRRLQADLAALSRQGKLRFATHAGHNLQVDDPDLVVNAIQEVLKLARR